MKIDITRINPQELEDREIVELNGITARCFQKEVPLGETFDHIREAQILHMLKSIEDGRIVGYSLNSLLDLLGHKINYFGSGFIEPEIQNNNLYNVLNQHRLVSLQANGIMTRTQSPRVFSGFRRMCTDKGYRMSPCLESGIDPELLQLARAFAGSCDESQICRGVYGRELMSITPLPNKASERIMGALNIKNGDGIILVGFPR